MLDHVVNTSYLIAAALFILSLKWMSSPISARRGVLAGEIGMLLAQEPQLLLVDEPAAGMTDEETKRTGELLISLSEKHSIVVV